MRKIAAIFLLFILSCSKPADYSHIRVTEVIDGDTVRLADGRLLRYIGVDTPEMRVKKQNRFIYSPQPYALEAKKLNSKLVEGQYIKIEFDVEKTDVYGRLLGYCFVGNTFVNAKLAEEGFAVLCTIPPNVKYADIFVRSQKDARENKRGLWGAYETIAHTEAGSYINQIRTVRGKIIGIRMAKRCIFLNFGKRYKDDFTVVIFNNSLPYFHKKGIDPLTYYKSKTVEVSGRIKEYNGPQIIVNDPADIRIIDEK